MDENKEWEIDLDRLLKRLSPYSVKKGLKVLKEYGIKQFLLTLKERFKKEELSYRAWLSQQQATDIELIEQSYKWFDVRPRISVVVPVYRTPENFLRQMIESVLGQSYGHLELCIADGSGWKDTEESPIEEILKEYSDRDRRMKYTILEENLGIAGNTNAAISMAKGDYIALLDHDDILPLNAIYEVVKAINEDPDIDIVYTDEDKISTNSKRHFTPHFKPDFNIDLLRTNNYICHLFIVSTRIVKIVGGFRSEFDGSQDYDFILRCVEIAENIYHLPKVLYHWRVHKGSVAENPESKQYAFEAGKRAIEDHLRRMKVNAQVTDTFNLGFYRISYQMKKESLVSILIFNQDDVENLKECLDSITSRTSYFNYEIVIIEDNSNKEETFNLYRQLENLDKVRVIAWDQISSLYNFGVSQTKGEFVIIISNKSRIITESWIEELTGNCQRNEVGVTGAKLYYPDDTIQNAGTIVGLQGVAGSPFVKMPKAYSGYFHKASIQQNLSAVISSCIMIKRTVFEEAGGFTENLSLEYALLDLCLKIRELEYLISYHPWVELYYNEDKNIEHLKASRAESSSEEIDFIRHKWKDILNHGDPYYNINLTLEKSNYSLKVVKELEN